MQTSMQSLLHLLRVFARSALREWHYLRHSPWDQAMLLWVPLLSLLFLWWVFSNEQVHDVRIAVVDKDNSSLSRQLLRYLDASPALKVQQYIDKNAAKVALQQRHAYALVTIGEDFSQRLSKGQPAPVKAFVNAQYGTHSGIVQSGLRQVVATFSMQQKAKLMIALGKPYQLVERAPSPLMSATQMQFNLSSNYRLFIAAGVMPALLHILATIAGAYGFGRELRDKSLEAKMQQAQIPKSDKGTKHVEFMSILAALHGKLFWPMLSYSTLAALSLLLIAQNQPVPALNWWLCFFNAYLMVAISLWLGVCLSASSLSLRVGLSLTALITAPAFAFSGVTFPLSAMPYGAQIMAKCLPLTHYLHTQIALFVQQVDAYLVLPNLAGFLLATIILMLLATLFSYRALNKPERWGAR